MTEDQILTIKEISAILKLAEKTVYSMAQDAEFPAGSRSMAGPAR